MKKNPKFIKELEISIELQDYGLNIENQEINIFPVFFNNNYFKQAISVNLSNSSCLHYQIKEGLLNEPPMLYILNEENIGFCLSKGDLLRIAQLNKDKNFKEIVIPSVLKGMYKKILKYL